MSRDELLWAGGLFEGEGCISQGTNKQGGSKYPEMMLAMTDKDSVDRFHRALGFGRRSVRVRGEHQDLYVWRVHNREHVQAAVAMLWSGLGARRRARAREVLFRVAA